MRLRRQEQAGRDSQPGPGEAGWVGPDGQRRRHQRRRDGGPGWGESRAWSQLVRRRVRRPGKSGPMASEVGAGNQVGRVRVAPGAGSRLAGVVSGEAGAQAMRCPTPVLSGPAWLLAGAAVRASRSGPGAVQVLASGPRLRGVDGAGGGCWAGSIRRPGWVAGPAAGRQVGSASGVAAGAGDEQREVWPWRGLGGSGRARS